MCFDEIGPVFLLNVFVFTGSGSASTIFIIRNRQFLFRDFEVSWALIRDEEYWLMGLTLPLFMLSIFRFMVFLIYRLYDLYWYQDVDRSPSFAMKFVRFIIGSLSMGFFVISIFIKNSYPEAKTYYIFSRFTGMLISSLFYSFMQQGLEVLLYRHWHGMPLFTRFLPC